LAGVGLAIYVVAGQLPKLGDLAGDAGEALAEGTGDFFEGVFGGAEQTETPVETIRTADDPDTLYASPEAMGSDPVFVPVAPAPNYDYMESPYAFYTVDYVQGEPVITVENPSLVPGPSFYEIEAPSTSREVGAYVGGLLPGLVAPQAISQGLFDYSLTEVPGDLLGGAKSVIRAPSDLLGGAKSVIRKLW
jgi:hypothetical protein